MPNKCINFMHLGKEREVLVEFRADQSKIRGDLYKFRVPIDR